MTDILSDYFDNFLSNGGHCPSLSSDRTYSKFNNNLTPYGIKISDNNILSFSPREYSKTHYKKQKTFYSPNPYINSNLLIESSTQRFSDFSSTDNNLKSSPIGNYKYKSMKNLKNLCGKKNFSETDYTENEKQSITKSRNFILIDDSNLNQTKTSIRPPIQYKTASPISFQTFNKNRNSSGKKIISLKKNISTSKKLKKTNKQIKNIEKADKIVNELLKLKSEKEIIDYFNKKNAGLKTNYKLFSVYQDKKHSENITGVERSVISPLEYIKYNLSKNPYNSEKYNSYKNQVYILGGEKNRISFLDGIDNYQAHLAKYTVLKGPKPCSIKENLKNDNLKAQKMHDMICNDIDKRFVFEKDSTLRTRKNIKKKKGDAILSLIDGDYQRFQKLLINLERNREGEILGYEDNEEYIKKHKKYLSFDQKLNNAIIRSQRTANYLTSRAEGHAKIRKAIDKLYENNNLNRY